MNKNNTDLKHKYKEDFDTVKNFVNDFDPCGLIISGAPNDEYDCLINQLLSATYNRKTRTEIKELILNEIIHHFGTSNLEKFSEPHKTNFYNELETILDKLEKQIEKKPSH